MVGLTELTLEGLGRSYGAARALDGVSLTLRAAQVHALMGENGAGKSTLIRLIAGLERPDAGRLLLNGRPVAFDSPAAAQAAGLRFIHQELHVVPALSVAENMHLSRPYPRRLGLVNWPALHLASAQALARLGLDRPGLDPPGLDPPGLDPPGLDPPGRTRIDPRQPMSRLGPGDQMLVRIAATLIASDGPAPWLYVMDEPTAALTGAEAGRLFAVVAELKAQGAGVLYVSHRMAEVMALSDRISVLRDGRHVSSHARAATDQARLIQDMTGRALTDQFPPRRVRSGAPCVGESAAPWRETARLTATGGSAAPLPDTGGSAAPLLDIVGLTAPGVRAISLHLMPGEVLGIVGLSGAGRGPLLRALIGDLPTAQGRVTLSGRPLSGGPAARWAAGLAYVPRERRSQGLIPTASVLENVTLPHLSALARAGLLQNRPRERRRLADLAAAVRLKFAGPGQSVGQLSGGNQQKVLFARAILGPPRVLLLDEPTRGVDIGAKFDIYALIRALCDRGMGVIVASSDLPEILGLADRIAVLQSGRLAHLVANQGLSEAALLALCHDDAGIRVSA